MENEDRFLISYTFNEISVVSLGIVRDVVLLEEEELVWNFLLGLVIEWKEEFLNLNFPSRWSFLIYCRVWIVILGETEIHAEVNIFVRFGDSIFRNVKIWYTKIRKACLSSYKRFKEERDGNEIALSPLLRRCIHYSCPSSSNVNLNSKFYNVEFEILFSKARSSCFCSGSCLIRHHSLEISCMYSKLSGKYHRYFSMYFNIIQLIKIEESWN